MRNRPYILFFAVILTVMVASCSKNSIHGDGFSHTHSGKAEIPQRIESEERRSLLLLYSAGHNNLSSYLKADIDDIFKGWLPGTGRNANILLIYSHFPAKGGSYSTPTSPTLTRVSCAQDGTILKDTIKIYNEGTISASAEQLHQVLSFVKEEFPVKTYGMIFSSHATGYLPTGYYSSPKSIGQEQVGSNSYEIELDDFAQALPMKMDYILFDACLMGGVEVAYELKDKCHRVGFSQTEVLAEGFDYKTITEHLLKSETPDPQAICEDYFYQYDIQSGIYRSATISLVDCSRMEPLAHTCRTLFEKYRNEIAGLSPGSVQRYYRSRYHWFYDLEDILAKAGITAEELTQLRESLNKCIIYKASTPEFMNEFRINTYSGLSMYLPCNGSAELDKYYKTLQWNIDTKLVE